METNGGLISGSCQYNFDIDVPCRSHFGSTGQILVPFVFHFCSKQPGRAAAGRAAWNKNGAQMKPKFDQWNRNGTELEHKNQKKYRQIPEIKPPLVYI